MIIVFFDEWPHHKSVKAITLNYFYEHKNLVIIFYLSWILYNNDSKSQWRSKLLRHESIFSLIKYESILQKKIKMKIKSNKISKVWGWFILGV